MDDFADSLNKQNSSTLETYMYNFYSQSAGFGPVDATTQIQTYCNAKYAVWDDIVTCMGSIFNESKMMIIYDFLNKMTD